MITDNTETAALLDIIGWSTATFASRMGVGLRTAQRWKNGQNETPENITKCLVILAKYHLTFGKPQGWDIKS